jgi:hypothetical protein
MAREQGKQEGGNGSACLLFLLSCLPYLFLFGYSYFVKATA